MPKSEIKWKYFDAPTSSAIYLKKNDTTFIRYTRESFSNLFQDNKCQICKDSGNYRLFRERVKHIHSHYKIHVSDQIYQLKRKKIAGKFLNL